MTCALHEDNMFNLMLFDEVLQTREDVVLRIVGPR